MGLIPRETQSNINQALRYLASIDKSLGRIAEALEKQNEQIPEVRTAEWYDDHNE